MLIELLDLFRSLAQFFQQPRVLNGDDGLGGEVRYELNLLLCKSSYLLTKNCNCADQFTFLEHRNGQNCSNASLLDGPAKRIINWISRIGQYVGDMDGRFCLNHAADSCTRTWTKWRRA